jgi:hypothetical protein
MKRKLINVVFTLKKTGTDYEKDLWHADVISSIMHS